MGRATSEEKQDWHNRGQEDAKEDRDWNPLVGPWRGPFESSEHYDDRNDAWKSGADNYHKQRSGR